MLICNEVGGNRARFPVKKILKLEIALSLVKTHRRMPELQGVTTCCTLVKF